MNKPFNKNISIHLIKQLSRERSRRFYIQGIPLPPSTADTADHNTFKKNKDDCVDESPALSKLSKYARTILFALVNAELPLMTKEIKSITKIRSDGAVHRAKIELQLAGLIQLFSFQSGKNHIHVWASREAAYQLCGIKKQYHHGIGAGPLHTFFQRKGTDSALEKGADIAKTEVKLSNGSFPDAIVRKGTALEYIQISLPPLEKELLHVLNAFDSALKTTETPDGLIMLVKDSKDKKKLEDLISADKKTAAFRDKITVQLAGDYINV